MTKRDRFLLEHYARPETQQHLDARETQDAMDMLDQVAKADEMAHQIAIAKRWLKHHWSKGWQAAGGPSGAPEPEPPPKKRRRKAKP